MLSRYSFSNGGFRFRFSKPKRRIAMSWHQLINLLYLLLPLLLPYLKQCYSTATAIESMQLFHSQPTPYLTRVRNLSTIIELEDFVVTQAAIYIDNVHEVYEKFFYKLLGDLPRRSVRSQQLQHLIAHMAAYLNVEWDLYDKLEKYEQFMQQHGERFAAIFEYDATETLLSANAFNDIYVENRVEEVLTYAHSQQLYKFVQHTGEGLRLYLILNRPRVRQQQLLEFKTIIDKFLEANEFLHKWLNLKLLLLRLREIFH